nr:Uma2 family endonuclease [Halochromatium glycolicum]
MTAAWAQDERVELIDGEIVKRPMARIEHGLAQSGLNAEIALITRHGGPRGWWIATEVSVEPRNRSFVSSKSRTLGAARRP